MVAGTRVSLGGLVVVLGALLGGLGCDAGGLLVAEGKDKPVAKGPPATELVSGGTFASNGKYRLFYVMGQPTPQQGVATSPDHRMNGGLTGAVHSK